MGIKHSDVDPDTLRKILEQYPAPQASAHASKPAHQRTEHPVRLQLVIQIPGLRMASEANIGGKLGAKLRRKSYVKETVRAALPPVMLPWPRPVRVVLTRLGTRKMDDDNLASAFKAVRDVVSEWLGIDDGDRENVRFNYEQRPDYWSGVEIRIG